MLNSSPIFYSLHLGTRCRRSLRQRVSSPKSRGESSEPLMQRRTRRNDKSKGSSSEDEKGMTHILRKKNLAMFDLFIIPPYQYKHF